MNPMRQETSAVPNRIANCHVSDAVFQDIYKELRRIASTYFRDERSGHTLQPTALVHEAYLRLTRLNRIDWTNRSLVLGISAGIMRNILVSHARRRRALKRSHSAVEVEVGRSAEARICDTLLLNDLLGKMEQSHAGAAKVIELRFFGGLSEEESAEFLGLSRATVQRHYSFARAWLSREFGRLPAREQ